MVAVKLALAAANRPHPGETVSGDAWQIDRHAAIWRIAVIDGLGHGPVAAAAARAARETLAAQPSLEPADVLRLCHQALAKSRGAAISIARIDLDAGRLTYAGVGNVEARLWQGSHAERLIAFRGIVGWVLPTIRAFEFPLGDDWLLLLHTDGVSSRCEPERLPEFPGGSPQELADAVLRTWGRDTDDATVLIARSIRNI